MSADESFTTVSYSCEDAHMQIIDAHNHVGGLASWGSGNGASG